MNLTMTSMLRRIKDVLQMVASSTIESRYLSFRIQHHRQDSLMKMVKNRGEKIYEKFETGILVDLLKKFSSPVMFDIGSNIGLMSLNICEMISDVRIYSFEPGPNQFAYLRRNIELNKLDEKVSIFNVALSNKNGEIDFCVHNVQNSSGDGILDTGRAGIGTIVKVKSQTADSWWEEQGRPNVNVIKLDTEGSELNILQSSSEILKHCRPEILVEICFLNYEKYGLTFGHHLEFFSKNNYQLLDAQTKLNIEHVAEVRKDQFYFLAIPIEKYEFYK